MAGSSKTPMWVGEQLDHAQHLLSAFVGGTAAGGHERLAPLAHALTTLLSDTADRVAAARVAVHEQYVRILLRVMQALPAGAELEPELSHDAELSLLCAQLSGPLRNRLTQATAELRRVIAAVALLFSGSASATAAAHDQVPVFRALAIGEPWHVTMCMRARSFVARLVFCSYPRAQRSSPALPSVAMCAASPCGHG